MVGDAWSSVGSTWDLACLLEGDTIGLGVSGAPMICSTGSLCEERAGPELGRLIVDEIP